MLSDKFQWRKYDSEDMQGWSNHAMDFHAGQTKLGIGQLGQTKLGIGHLGQTRLGIGNLGQTRLGLGQLGLIVPIKAGQTRELAPLSHSSWTIIGRPGHLSFPDHSKAFPHPQSTLPVKQNCRHRPLHLILHVGQTKLQA